MRDLAEEEKLLWIIYMIMQHLCLDELYLPKEFLLKKDSPHLTVTYDCETKQYVFKLKKVKCK